MGTCKRKISVSLLQLRMLFTVLGKKAVNHLNWCLSVICSLVKVALYCQRPLSYYISQSNSRTYKTAPHKTIKSILKNATWHRSKPTLVVKLQLHISWPNLGHMRSHWFWLIHPLDIKFQAPFQFQIWIIFFLFLVQSRQSHDSQRATHMSQPCNLHRWAEKKSMLLAVYCTFWKVAIRLNCTLQC